MRTCSSIVHNTRLQGVTGEVAALRENVTKFWQDEAQSGPRDEVHRDRHAALLQQLQAVEQRSSSLYYLLDTLASENQAFESHWDSPAPPLPPSPQQNNDVVIGRCVAFRSPSYPSAVHLCCKSHVQWQRRVFRSCALACLIAIHVFKPPFSFVSCTIKHRFSFPVFCGAALLEKPLLHKHKSA
jgi:hypothetical protein